VVVDVEGTVVVVVEVVVVVVVVGTVVVVVVVVVGTVVVVVVVGTVVVVVVVGTVVVVIVVVVDRAVAVVDRVVAVVDRVVGVVMLAVEGAASTSPQQRTPRTPGSVLCRHSDAAENLVLPAATTKPPGQASPVQVSAKSRLHPLPRATLSKSSSEVHSRALAASHMSLAWLWDTKPGHEGMLSPHTVSLDHV